MSLGVCVKISKKSIHRKIFFKNLVFWSKMDQKMARFQFSQLFLRYPLGYVKYAKFDQNPFFTMKICLHWERDGLLRILLSKVQMLSDMHTYFYLLCTLEPIYSVESACSVESIYSIE